LPAAWRGSGVPDGPDRPCRADSGVAATAPGRPRAGGRRASDNAARGGAAPRGFPPEHRHRVVASTRDRGCSPPSRRAIRTREGTPM